MFFSIKSKQKGYTLIEVLVAILILSMVIISIFSLIKLSFKLIGRSEARITASNLANQQMELLRNMTYDNLGTTSGWPNGQIPSTQTKTLNNINYTTKTDIQYYDDPLDGVAPADLYNADYKKARVEVAWNKYPAQPVILVSNFSPKGIEAPIGGGTMSLSIINTKSEGVGGATIHIQNTNLTPNINITTQTDGNGKLLVPALPKDSGNNYFIEATKSGYTRDYTLPITTEMPKPILSHQTILEGEVTSVTLTIDQTSNLNLHTLLKTKTSNWCDEAYKSRKQLTIKNNSSSDAPNGLSIKYSFNHKELVSAGKSKDSGDDVRIFYWNGAACEELDRINTTDWNSDQQTEIWFKTQNIVSAGSTDDSYYFYYNNSNSGDPPKDLTKIFNPEKDNHTKGLYYFEDKTGSVLTDYSGNGNNGALNNNNWVSGKDGYSLEFLPSPPPSYTAIPADDDSSLDIAGSITLEAWIYPTDLTGKKSIIDRDHNYALWLEDNYLYFGVYETDIGMKKIKSDATISANAWTHIAGTYSHTDGVLKIFINGNDDKTDNQKIENFFSPNSADLGIGNGYIIGELTSQFIGKIDEARISDTARSSFPYAKLIDFSVSEGEEKGIYANIPQGNVPIKILGERILGFDPDNKGILRNKFEDKYSDANGNLSLSGIEWDSYTTTEESPTYDLADISIPNPAVLSPGETKEINILLVEHTDNTLHVTIKNASQAPLSDANVKLSGNGFDETKKTESPGQVFFTLPSSNGYTLEISKSGYITSSESINISGNVEKEVILSSS